MLKITREDELLRVIEILALAFNPDDLCEASADAIDVLAEIGVGAEDFGQDDEDSDGTEDFVDQHIRYNRLKKHCSAYRYKQAAFEDTVDNDDRGLDDWDGSKADDGPEDTPADLIGDANCVSLFMAPDVAEAELHRLLEKKIPYQGRVGWSPRYDNVGVLGGRRVRVIDLRRSAWNGDR